MNMLLGMLALTSLTAQAAQLSLPLTLTVTRSCVVVSTSSGVEPLVLKCNRGSAAPISPLEVAAAPLLDWQLVAHASSQDGGELFSYLPRANAAVQGPVTFY